jgi:hypothetical protein
MRREEGEEEEGDEEEDEDEEETNHFLNRSLNSRTYCVRLIQ